MPAAYPLHAREAHSRQCLFLSILIHCHPLFRRRTTGPNPSAVPTAFCISLKNKLSVIVQYELFEVFKHNPKACINFPFMSNFPALCSMAKSRSTVRWVTDKVADICVRHVSAIYTGRVYGKSPASDSSYFVFGLPHCKCTLFSIQFSPFHKLSTNVNFSVFNEILEQVGRCRCACW